MTTIPVSIVVVSRDRPDALKLCLTSLSQLHYEEFEVIVVTNAEGLKAVQALPFTGSIKQVLFDEPNISAARNLGIEAAGGDVVAFIDDDAIAEPTWLTHLVDPFAKADVSCVGGYVRGRNGISFQWTAQTVDYTGQTSPVEMHKTNPKVIQGTAQTAIKTEGTNMAVRRDTLVELGGLDTAFRYFHDETDLNMRLAQEGYSTAIVPLAQVHHGYLGNSSRTVARVPTDLHQIGASWAVFFRKHAPSEKRGQLWADVQKDQRHRCLRHMVDGRLEPRDVRRLMKSLNAGYKEGLTRAVQTQSNLATDSPFHAFERTVPSNNAHSGWVWSKSRLIDAAKPGDTVFLYSPTTLFHRAWMADNGVWMQRGGLFGKSDRSDPLFKRATRNGRTAREMRRLEKIRPFRR
jgi:GT2 family glycosyltransferase